MNNTPTQQNHGEMYEDLFEKYRTEKVETRVRDATIPVEDLTAAFIGARYGFQLCLDKLRCTRDYFKSQWQEMQKFRKEHWDNPDLSSFTEKDKQ